MNDTILEILVLTRIPSYVTMSDSLFLNIDVYLDDKLVFPMSEPIATTSNTLPSPVSTVFKDKLYEFPFFAAKIGI